jgi:hypothetical protein
MISQKQLLCTFTNSERYLDSITDIKKLYDLVDKKLFLFVNEKNPREVYITFNVVKNDIQKIKYKNTIGIHRKKQTNTLYTLNAMNRLIETKSGNDINKNLQLDWELYKNNIILVAGTGVKIVKLKLFSIVSL